MHGTGPAGIESISAYYKLLYPSNKIMAPNSVFPYKKKGVDWTSFFSTKEKPNWLNSVFPHDKKNGVGGKTEFPFFNN